MATLAQSPPTAPASSLSSHPFTCNTCQVAFRSGDLQRTHMQSDWHRYNLKRRVASLPPLTSEVFAEKVLANKATAAATAARASFVKTCDACDKTYYSEGAYLNHIGSQKHKLLVARRGHETDSMADSTFSLGDPMETASTTASTMTARDHEAEEEFDEVVEGLRKTKVSGASDPVPERPTIPTPSKAGANGHIDSDDSDDSDDEEMDEDYEHKADLQQCLFCNYLSPTKALNIHHMGKQHGFFVPETDYLVNMDGLITYLHETINVLHQCLFCHKQVHTTSGVQTHMRDRGHCMIAYSTEDEQMEVGEFYDFRSTYSDEETDSDAEEANGGVRLGARRAAKTTVQNEDGEDIDMDEEDEGWESDSSLSSVPTDEITSIPIDRSDRKYAKLDKHRHHSHKDPRPHKNSDGFHSHAHSTPQAVYHDEYELHLPSGRTAGHRSLKAYFRQNLRNYPTPEERAEQRMLEAERHDSDADDEDAETTTGRGRGRSGQLVGRGGDNMGMIGVSDAKKREIKAVEKRERKREQRAQARYQWGNDKQNNFQKHFRDPLLQ